MFTGTNDLLAVPDLRLWHYNAGAEVAILDPTAARVSLAANLGAGATTIDTDAFQGARDGLTRTYFALNGGVRLGYDISRNVNVFASGQAYATFGDNQDIRALTALAPDLAGQDVNTLWSFPLQAGIRFSLPNSRTLASRSSR